jgi:Holliday junction resolvase
MEEITILKTENMNLSNELKTSKEDMTHLSADHAEQVVWFLAKFLCHLLIF